MKKILVTSILVLAFTGSSFAAPSVDSNFRRGIFSVNQSHDDLCIFTFSGTVYNGDINAFNQFLERVHVEKSEATWCTYQETYTDGSGHFSIPGFTEFVIFTFTKDGFGTQFVLNNGIDPDAPMTVTMFPE